MGETNGKKGVWAYVRGGMGGISNALAAAAKDMGVEIRCTSEVARIQVKYDDAKYGMPSRDPIVEMTMPSALDNTVAPPGKHLASMFVQYAPYKLKEGTWDDARKNAFADRCFDIVEQYAPGFKASVIDRQL